MSFVIWNKRLLFSFKVPWQRNLKKSGILLKNSINLQNFKQIWPIAFFILHFLFFHYMSVVQLWRHTGPHLNKNEAWNQEHGDVYVYDFEPRYLENQLAYEGQWWLVRLDISCSFIWAQLVLNPEFPFNSK